MHFWRSFQNYLLGKGFPPPRLLQNYYLAHDLLTLDHENDLRNSHLSYLINPNGSFVGTKGTGSAQVMHSSSDPNATAEAFAKQAFGDNVPLKVTPLTIKGHTGGWYATFSDGRAVTYRPAGASSSRTPVDMATVQVNNTEIDYLLGKPIKFKFPAK
mgnify:CR=1 FL=1